MAQFQRKRLGDMLIAENVVTAEQVDQAFEAKKGTNKRLGEMLVELNFTTEEKICHALERQLGIEMVNLMGEKMPPELNDMITGSLCRKHGIFPFGFDEYDVNVLKLAMVDPMDLTALDDVEMITGLQVEPYIATNHDIALAIDKTFGNEEAQSAADAYAKERGEKYAAEEEAKDEIEDSPIVILVKTTIEQAARLRASDIHIEALESRVRIRYRIDGSLVEQISYDISLLPAITARLKIISGMDIAEKRKPQDGRITQVVDRNEYDIRVSMLPTVYGEKCVMRLALKTALNRDKKDLGFAEDELKVFDHILANPNGIILVTGPTGSGKSTTLYTALSELNTEDVNIITVEDPVEANIDGINQVHVNVKAGLTFASALRSILRQDPDIIMIGEIRDGETAQIAVQAAITGHLVVSTLHTNSSAATISRLEDMGIESYLVADSVKGVIAQRLVKRLCPNCKEEIEATEEEKEIMGVPLDQPCMMYKPVGCPLCNHGYKGRIGVYEIMELNSEMKQIISQRRSTDELKEAAIRNGMNTLRMAATKHVLNGITSYSEMMRISFDS
ncbi:MAG: type II/IV secretion system protein [Lachnospiraceae bacterium]|nr:type II/IV secretion system protein [Lachnospiraceae bacterium]